jgi:hypothetical protein
VHRFDADIECVDRQEITYAFDDLTTGRHTEIKLDGDEYLIVREDEILDVAEGVPEVATASKGRSHGRQADRVQRRAAPGAHVRRQHAG